MLARLEENSTATPRQYLLGALWIFAVPALGLIVGTAVAGQWDGHPWRQAMVIVGGLAGGILAGVLGRKATLPTQPSCPQVEGNHKE